MQEKTYRTRKSLSKLTELQWRHYFFLIRLLHIAPPRQESKGKNSYRVSEVNQNSRSLFQEFTSIHNTCCEHWNPFFAYWHRYVFSLFEQFLLRCHDYILKINNNPNIFNSQVKRLFAISSGGQVKQKDVREGLSKTVNAYIQLINCYQSRDFSRKSIAAHYWDLFEDNLYYPKGFYRKKVNGKYELNDWDKYFVGNADILIKLLYNETGIFELNYRKRLGVQNETYHLNTHDQSTIKQSFRKEFDPNDAHNRANQFQIAANAFKVLPQDFFTMFGNARQQYSIETAHNGWHVSIGSLLEAPPTATLNPLFFAYHSFIQLLLEIKIQWINQRVPLYAEKGQSLLKAVQSIENYLNNPIISRSGAQNLWSKYLESKGNATPRYEDYPIFVWITPTFRQNSLAKDLKQSDFLAASRTYRDIMIHEKDGVKRLKQLKESFGSTYDVQYTKFTDPKSLIGVLKKMVDSVKGPYNLNEQNPILQQSNKQSAFKISNLEIEDKVELLPDITLQVVYKSSLSSRKLDVSIYDIHQNRISDSSIYTFSRGLDAKYCPRCQTYKIQDLLFRSSYCYDSELEEVDLTKMKLVTIKGRPHHFIWRPEHRVQNNIFWKSNDQNFILKHKTGRRSIKVSLANLEGEYYISAKFIREGRCIYDEEVYETYSVKEKESLTISKRDYYIESIELFNNEGLSIQYEFPLFSQESQLSLGLSRNQESQKQSSFRIQKQSPKVEFKESNFGSQK